MKEEYLNSEFLFNLSMYELAKLLFPFSRSLTGEGIKKSYDIFRLINSEFKTITFKTGEKVGDWEIPNQWEIKDGFIQLENGSKICEFKKCNLSVVGYSIPINKKINYEELVKHLHYRKDLPNAIPYVTSYYKKNWGFCIEYELFKTLKKKEKFTCFIDSQLKPGKLEVIEALVESKENTNKDIFFSSYLCHPSMANNELSGPVLISELIKYTKTLNKRNYNYRFVLLPETIGSIAYLSRRSRDLIKKVICGYNLSCCGDNHKFTHLQSPFGNNIADKALRAALIGKDNVYSKTFLERGSDERQYCSPRINLPLCGFSRSMFGEYKEYHTNLDNLSFISQEGLSESFNVMKSIIDTFEFGIYPLSLTLGEPQLGKRNLYSNLSHYISGQKRNEVGIRMDILAYCNGQTSVFEIAILIKVPLTTVLKELKLLASHKLIRGNHESN